MFLGKSSESVNMAREKKRAKRHTTNRNYT